MLHIALWVASVLFLVFLAGTSLLAIATFVYMVVAERRKKKQVKRAHGRTRWYEKTNEPEKPIFSTPPRVSKFI